MISARSKLKDYPVTERIEMLAKPRPVYHGTDFFHRRDFRGLFLADNQEAIGADAFKCVDKINTDTVSLFNTIKAFKDDIGLKNEVKSYYRTRGSSPVNSTIQSTKNRATANATTGLKSSLTKSLKIQSRNTKAFTSVPCTRTDLKTTLASKMNNLVEKNTYRSNISNSKRHTQTPRSTTPSLGAELVGMQTIKEMLGMKQSPRMHLTNYNEKSLYGRSQLVVVQELPSVPQTAEADRTGTGAGITKI
jgi:hypothetical protein